MSENSGAMVGLMKTAHAMRQRSKELLGANVSVREGIQNQQCAEVYDRCSAMVIGIPLQDVAEELMYAQDINKYHELMPDIWNHISTLQIVQELKRRYPTELKMLLGVQELLETNRRMHPEQRETRESS